MKLFLYTFFLKLYYAGVTVTSLWNSKAKKWLVGRKNIFETITTSLKNNSQPVVWIHCASLGEFEQGRPLIENIKKQYPQYKIVLTFFSPSGYEVQKNYPAADHIFYLPLDTKNNAQQFLDLIKPSLVLFIKYDLWYYYLAEVRKRNIPLLLVSAVFRSNQSFFKWYGNLQRKMLHFFNTIFVQNKISEKLLQEAGFKNVLISGDTRFDRVHEIASQFEPINFIDSFVNHQPCIVAGSTWKDDEDALQQLTQRFPDVKIIIAPHEINISHLADIQKLFPQSIFYSSLEENANLSFEKVLVIDNVGMLSKLYKYATITYVGGGFTTDGIHNTLEAAVWGKPVLFGPNYKKYIEASELIAASGAFSFTNANELLQQTAVLLGDKTALATMSAAAKNYVLENTGATAKVLQYIQEKRLLTN